MFDATQVLNIQRLLTAPGDLKSNHSKYRLFEGRFSNGWALEMAVGSICPNH